AAARPQVDVGFVLERVAVHADGGLGVIVVGPPVPARGVGAGTDDLALLVGAADQDAEALVLAVPGVHARDLGRGAVVGIGTRALDGNETLVGRHFQRAAGVHD